MAILHRMLANICVKDLELSKAFYTNFFDFSVQFDSDWFVHLISSDKGFELGLLIEGHTLVPPVFQGKPQNMYLSFVIDDVDDFFSVHQFPDETIIEVPHDTPYGQRRILLVDPSGVLLDVSSPTVK